jgi:hypothetical protein
MDLFFYKHEIESCRKIILQSPIHLQELLLETMISLGLKNKFVSFILDHYTNQNRLKKNENQYISYLLSDEIRIYDIKKKEWYSESSTTNKKNNEEEDEEFIKKYITENSYKYYGIIEISKEKTSFKIRDVSNTELIFGTNKSKIPKGEICENSFSRKKSGLIEILLRLKYTPPSIENKMSIEEIKTFFMMKEKEKLINDIKKIMGSDYIFSNDEWKTIYYLSQFKIPLLCQITRERFKQLDLLYQKNI